MATQNRDQNLKSVHRILWMVLVANLTITIIKISLGVVTGALAVVADGFHSLVDTSSNLIGISAIRLASRPADNRHPYGYKRYETLGALAIGGFLIVAVWEIIQNLFERILHGAEPEITLMHLILISLTFPVNLGITLYETKAGNRLDSKILLADAAHTRTDLFVTGSVIASMIGVWLGLGWLDIVLASFVVILILKASVGILRDSVTSLADAVMVNPDQVRNIALGVKGVRYVHNIRSRGSHDSVFVDLHVKVDPLMSTSQAHAIASEVEDQICSQSSRIVDAIVHIEPAIIEKSSDWDYISLGLRQIADGMGLGLHDLHVHVDGVSKYSIELDLEIRGDVTISIAHKLADEFERKAQKFFPKANQIITHLEPANIEIITPVDHKQFPHTKEIENIIESSHKAVRIIDLQTRTVEDKSSLIIKLSMPSETPLADSHAKVEEMKQVIFNKFSEISRIVIHVEPAD